MAEREDLDPTPLFEEAYDELRRLAGGALAKQRADHTLQPTGLVHEAWVRLSNAGDVRVNDREHFLATAALAMRQILVEAARRRHAAKRGGAARRLTLTGKDLGETGDVLDVLELHDALERLASHHPRQARLVELRFFGGLEVDEAARVLDISKRTAATDWRFARAWLAERLDEGSPS